MVHSDRDSGALSREGVLRLDAGDRSKVQLMESDTSGLLVAHIDPEIARAVDKAAGGAGVGGTHDDVTVDASKSSVGAAAVEAASGGSRLDANSASAAEEAALNSDPNRTPEMKALLRKHRLSKALIAPLSRDGAIVVTWANYHYRDFVNNWVVHIRKAGCQNFVVGALDDRMLEWLVENGIPAFAMHTGLSPDDLKLGSPSFQKMGREKVNLIHAFTDLGFATLVSDVDTVWLNDPLPFMARYPDADILISSDNTHTTVTEERLERWPEGGGVANIGIMLVRPGAKPMIDRWLAIMDENNPENWDQNVFNVLMLDGMASIPGRDDGVFSAYRGAVKMGFLPVAQFSSGHVYFVVRLYKVLGLKPYVFHATFQYSGTPGKRNRIREDGSWMDPDDYFRHPVGFVSHERDLPQKLLDDMQGVRGARIENTLPHFALVNHQLSQVRGNMILSQLLGGRAVVLPELWCGFDRWWSPHTGVTPQSNLTLPYLCPADHVMDLEAWHDRKPNTFREYSFLRKDQAKGLLNSKLTLVVCQEGEAGCADGSAPAAARNDTIRLQPRRTAAQVLTAVQAAAQGRQLVHVEGKIAQLFQLTQDELKEAKNTWQDFTSHYCCVNKNPGHIWYDLFWDVGPHNDRFNRPIGEVWEPQCGP